MFEMINTAKFPLHKSLHTKENVFMDNKSYFNAILLVEVYATSVRLFLS